MMIIFIYRGTDDHKMKIIGHINTFKKLGDLVAVINLEAQQGLI